MAHQGNRRFQGGESYHRETLEGEEALLDTLEPIIPASELMRLTASARTREARSTREVGEGWRGLPPNTNRGALLLVLARRR